VKILCQKIRELADPKFHDENFKLLEETLIKNGYPISFIKQFSQITTRTEDLENTNDIEKYISIPYNNVLFGKLKCLLSAYNIKVVGKAQTSFKNIFYSPLKDKIDKKYCTNIVYEITCECDSTYIGQTSQHAINRFNQHLKGDSEHSSLSAHLIENGHNITFENFKIMCVENKQRARDVKEMIYINQRDDRLNAQTDTMFLSECYAAILK